MTEQISPMASAIDKFARKLAEANKGGYGEKKTKVDCTPASVQPDKAKMLAKNKVVTWGVAHEKDDIFERNQDISLE